MGGSIVSRYLGYSGKPWMAAVSIVGEVGGVMLGGWYHCASISRVLGEAMGVCRQPCGRCGVGDVGWLVSLCLGISGTRGNHGCL